MLALCHLRAGYEHRLIQGPASRTTRKPKIANEGQQNNFELFLALCALETTPNSDDCLFHPSAFILLAKLVEETAVSLLGLRSLSPGEFGLSNLSV
jgi:hypothetical protein